MRGGQKMVTITRQMGAPLNYSVILYLLCLIMGWVQQLKPYYKY